MDSKSSGSCEKGQPSSLLLIDCSTDERTQDGAMQTTSNADTAVASGASLNIPLEKKQFGIITIVSFAFVICNSWAGVSGSLQLALLAGGPVTLVYGILISTIIYICIALSMAELASAYPTAGGQYHFASILAPKAINQGISYACGLVSLLSWIAIGSSVTLIPAQQIPALVTAYSDTYTEHSWHVFLIYEAVALVVLLFNLFALKRNPWVHEVGFCLTICLFVVSFIGILSRSKPKAPNSQVWTAWSNYTGWPDGVCFILGISTSCFMFIGLDAAMHLAEECTDAARTVPKAVVSAIVIGFCTAFPYTIAVLYGISDLSSVLTTTGYIPLETMTQCLQSLDFATVLACGGIFMAFFALNAVQETASRLTWSFARDNGLVFSTHLQRIHPRWQVPVWSLFITWGILAIYGCIFLGSSTAFNALVNSAIALQQLSFLIPIALLLYRKRDPEFLPITRAFVLPHGVGLLVNILAVVFTSVTTVFFCFPLILPMTASNMSTFRLVASLVIRIDIFLDYTSAIIGIAFALGVVNWIVHARKHYQGPHVELDGRIVGGEFQIEE
ncbi:uncharacterized protein A1O9_10281 [Exophiala aquamarina CBS 119918]|uniref:Choline transport protein n=1 Tax=Exophiala aquamarina CBS 119918 TaxID=1182545 RepID=A0A072P188_9EURO|nr:uncharacterized protein A1O9_10281 [Exophiala aquamarina CBS 119918]KEF53879.1 hypothetical protein A1O9_10281 [Exophiala aquamarina CBS 119918]